MPHFVVVEDDHLQEGPIADNLAGMFPDAIVEAFATEEEFANTSTVSRPGSDGERRIPPADMARARHSSAFAQIMRSAPGDLPRLR